MSKDRLTVEEYNDIAETRELFTSNELQYFNPEYSIYDWRSHSVCINAEKYFVTAFLNNPVNPDHLLVLNNFEISCSKSINNISKVTRANVIVKNPQNKIDLESTIGVRNVLIRLNEGIFIGTYKPRLFNSPQVRIMRPVITTSSTKHDYNFEFKYSVIADGVQKLLEP